MASSLPPAQMLLGRGRASEGQSRSMMAGAAGIVSATADGGWQLCHDARSQATEERDHTLFALANGSLGVRAGCEEAGGSGGCFLAEVYGRSAIHRTEGRRVGNEWVGTGRSRWSPCQ